MRVLTVRFSASASASPRTFVTTRQPAASFRVFQSAPRATVDSQMCRKFARPIHFAAPTPSQLVNAYQAPSDWAEKWKKSRKSRPGTTMTHGTSRGPPRLRDASRRPASPLSTKRPLEPPPPAGSIPGTAGIGRRVVRVVS